MIPHEDKVGVFTPFNSTYCSEGVANCGEPHEDNVDVFTPINILFKGGGEF